MREWLRAGGHAVNRKRISRLLALMGIEAVYPKPKLSQPGEGHRIYPYLLRGTTVERVNQVWSTDITYIGMAQGFLYLVAVMDWFSRFVLSWSLSEWLPQPNAASKARPRSSRFILSPSVVRRVAGLGIPYQYLAGRWSLIAGRSLAAHTIHAAIPCPARAGAMQSGPIHR